MRTHWDRRAAHWESHLPAGQLFAELRRIVMTAVAPSASDVAADLGAGTGFLTAQLADRARRIYIVDNSSAMLAELRANLARAKADLVIVQADLRRFDLPEPIDIVVSNYALHHLRDRDKRALLDSCHNRMASGGRIAISDNMVPLTLRPGQSARLRYILGAMIRKGPSGIWRIVKNATRWAAGRGEYPASLEFWTDALRATGFVDVHALRVGGDSGVVWGRKPSAGGNR